MSATTSDASAAGVRVTQSANNVYTVLLIIALLVVASSAVYLGVVSQNRFGYAMPFGETFEASQQAVTRAADETVQHAAFVEETMTSWSLSTRLGGAAGQ